MKTFAIDRIFSLDAYTPGEQPRDMKYIKLNTNESPYPPSPGVARMIAGDLQNLNLYSDPACSDLAAAASRALNIPPEAMIFTNGSDELLNFALLAFCDGERGAAFPDVTYGLYSALCEMYGIPYEKIPLGGDFRVNPDDYSGLGKNIILANPNAPTGLFLPVADIARILESNRDRVVIIDEAYIAFGGESCAPLIDKYDNLLIARTFSKSHSLAGARLGMGIGAPGLIKYLNKVKYTFNAYSVNRMTQLAGIAAFEEAGYYAANCSAVAAARERAKEALRRLGFFVTDSAANFLFVRSDRIGGEELYERLRERGILVRHFSSPRIADFNRITVGTGAQTDALIEAVAGILSDT